MININGINIDEHGGGYSVTVRAFVGKREDKESAIARILAVMKELGVSDHEAKVPEREDDQARPAAEAPAPRARVQRARKDAEPSGTSGRRGRGRAAPAAEAGKGDDGDGGAAKPSQGRAKASASDGGADPAHRRGSRDRTRKVGVEEPAPVGRRGSRAKAADEAITDIDLTKAASEAATLITPKGVKEIMAEFKVESVGDIPHDRRQEFLVALDRYVPF